MSLSEKERQTKTAYNARPENVAKRVKNNAARRQLMREGKVSVGDGKDVGHKKPLDKGGGNERSNLRVEDAKQNQAWRKRNPEMYGKK